MGFSLQALDERGKETDEHLSLSNAGMRDLRDIVADIPPQLSDDGKAVLFALSVNQGEVVSAQQCQWLADRLRRVDRERICGEEPEPAELLELVDAVRAFCERCSQRGGFEVW